MTYFAPVAPLKTHRQLAQRDALGPYNLLIASEIIKDIPAHKEFWTKHRLRNPGRGELYVDNGVIELGYALPIGALRDACEAVKATTVILPDTIDDMRMTVKQVRNAADQWRAQGAPGVRMLGVVQGTTVAECADCADAHAKAGVDMLAIPRGLTRNLGSRYDITRLIAEEHGLPMHLLGFSENVEDDIVSAAVAAPDYVLGLDAATPVWLGMASAHRTLGARPPKTANWGPRPSWFWQAGPQAGDSMFDIVHNIEQVNKWLSDATKNASVLRAALTAHI